MDRETLAAQSRTKQLVQVIIELTLVSHVRGTSYDKTPTSGKPESLGLPPGGVDRKGDREDSYRQKSAEHFARRLEGLCRGLDKCSDKRAESLRDEILTDAREAIRAWRVTPNVPGVEPERGTLQWKCKIANDPRPSRVVAGHFGTSHVSVLRYRKQYAGIRA